MKNRRKWIVRVVALVMAFLLIGSVVIVALQAFSEHYSPKDSADMKIIQLGSGEGDDSKWPIYVVAGAGVLVVACLLLPKLKKKQ